MNYGVMLNAYPDSIGETLRDAVDFLKRPEIQGAFTSSYFLPTLFHTDIDHGFSVISYDLNELTATEEDLKELQAMGMDLKMDFILNHLSALSPQYQDVVRRGEESPYKDFFINWNTFWKDHGTMTEEGFIQPDPDVLKVMPIRKEILPFMFMRYPDGKKVPYWNTFYQDIQYQHVDYYDVMQALGVQYTPAMMLSEAANAAIDAGKTPSEIDYGALNHYKAGMTDLLKARRRCMGQMDLNIDSPLVWDFYREVLTKLKGLGATMVRLDAFTMCHKEPGRVNFMNEPETWDVMGRVRKLTEEIGLEIIAEVHVPYATGAYEKLNKNHCTAYDFFLPGMIIDALDLHDATYLRKWAQEIHGKKLDIVNMLGCHDGIPLRDIHGLLPDERITALGDRMMERGGLMKLLFGAQKIYYQMDVTYYSALGEDDKKMVMARALQMFMPGRPEVWYLDLFVGKNDYANIEADPMKQNREINRTRLSLADVEEGLKKPVVKAQIELIRLRSGCPAFSRDAQMNFEETENGLRITWRHAGAEAMLEADLHTYDTKVTTSGWEGAGEFRF